MKGIDLAKAYYEEYGRPMLERDFPEHLNKIAVGLVGHGSECFGFDDEVSRDHDYQAGFCIFIRKEDEKDIGFKLMRAYNNLPKEFKGIALEEKSAYGNKGRGVQIIEDFYRFYTGRDGAPETMGDWLYTPSHYLAQATNGEVFYDGLGEFSRIREEILLGMPEDVRLKKISACSLAMAQTGQYNFPRMLSRGDKATAELCLSRFVEYACEMVHLLNKSYAPYYKWLLRSAESQFILGDKVKLLRNLSEESVFDDEKISLAEEFCKAVIDELVSCGLSKYQGDYLEPYAFYVNENVSDSELRNLQM